MADVMVVALFMAYIGFHRMIHTQMQEIGTDNPHVNVLGTDGTQLLIGFFLFLGFCIASLIVSSVIEAQDQAPGDSAESPMQHRCPRPLHSQPTPSKGVSISPRDKKDRCRAKPQLI